MTDSATTGHPLLLPGSSDPMARAPQSQPTGFDDSVYQRLLRERIIFLGSAGRGQHRQRTLGADAAAGRRGPREGHLPLHQLAGRLGLGGMAIYDTMQFVPCDVATVAMGLAASMGQFLLCAGAEGKRYALPHARIMMHQPSGGIGGTASDIKIQAEQMLYTKKKMAELIAAHTGQTTRRDRVRLRPRPLVHRRRGQGVRLRRPCRQPGARRRRQRRNERLTRHGDADFDGRTTTEHREQTLERQPHRR